MGYFLGLFLGCGVIGYSTNRLEAWVHERRLSKQSTLKPYVKKTRKPERQSTGNGKKRQSEPAISREHIKEAVRANPQIKVIELDLTGPGSELPTLKATYGSYV